MVVRVLFARAILAPGDEAVEFSLLFDCQFLWILVQPTTACSKGYNFDSRWRFALHGELETFPCLTLVTNVLLFLLNFFFTAACPRCSQGEGEWYSYWGNTLSCWNVQTPADVNCAPSIVEVL